MLGVQNAISPVSRLQFPHNPSSTDLFQAPPSPNSFQSASSPKVHQPLLSEKINPSQLTTLYRIDSQIKFLQLPSSSNLLRLRSPKPVLTVKPPVRRYGAEMPRVNPFATPVVSLAFHFDSFSRVCASPQRISSTCRVRSAACHANVCVARTICPHVGTLPSFSSYLIVPAMLTCIRHSPVRMFSSIIAIPSLTRVCSQ